MPLYQSYGLIVEADVPIQGLPPLGAPRSPDVRICHDSLPDVPAPNSSRPEGVRREEGIYFTWPNIGVYRIEDSDRIICDPNPGVDPRCAMEPVLGVLLGVVLHLRGRYTLHASAVVMESAPAETQRTGEWAVAFVGWKGEGKSTTAAAFQQAGCRLLTDDVLALEGLPGSKPRACPSFPRLKLSRTAAQELGYDWEQLSGLGEPMTKRAWTEGEGFCQAETPLAAVFELNTGDAVACEQMSEREGTLTLLKQSYAPRFLGAEWTGAQHLNQCSDLVQRVPVYRLQRPRQFEVLPQLVETVQERVLAAPTTP